MKYFKNILTFFIIFISMFILCYFIPVHIVNNINSINFNNGVSIDENQIKYMMDYGYSNNVNKDFFENVITLDNNYTNIVVNTEKNLVLFVSILLSIIDILLMILFSKNDKLKYHIIISGIILILFNSYYIITTFNGLNLLIK